MAYRFNEDIGTGKRGRMTPARALKAWERHKGVCVNCHQRIDGARDDWFIEHILALDNGGTDDDANTGPAHVPLQARQGRQRQEDRCPVEGEQEEAPRDLEIPHPPPLRAGRSAQAADGRNNR